jgi:hypothetical protein
MHRGLPYSCSVLASSTCVYSGSSSCPWSMWYTQRCKYETNINAMHGGAKCNILHDHELLKHINPYKLFTKLPLAFLIF